MVLYVHTSHDDDGDDDGDDDDNDDGDDDDDDGDNDGDDDGDDDDDDDGNDDSDNASAECHYHVMSCTCLRDLFLRYITVISSISLMSSNPSDPYTYGIQIHHDWISLRQISGVTTLLSRSN